MRQGLPTNLPIAEVQDRATPENVHFQTMGHLVPEARPLLILFTSGGRFTLETPPYRRIGQVMQNLGWNVVSLDLPCEGNNKRANEPESLLGWATRTKAGENVVAELQTRTSAVVQYLLATGEADPQCIAIAGTSRGAFMAFHAAAAIDQIKAIIGFSPVTDLAVLTEFGDQKDTPLIRSLALEKIATTLAQRAIWITIGHDDQRVGTDKAIGLIAKIHAAATTGRHSALMSFHILPTSGHDSFTSWHDDAGSWLHETLRARTTMTLSRSNASSAVPCTVYPSTKKSGAAVGLVIHLYGSGGSATDYNLMRSPYNRLRQRLSEEGYLIVVPELGPNHWMNETSAQRLDAIIHEFVANGEVNPNRVHIVGTSMGGGSALIYALRRTTKLRSVCAIFPMTDFEAWIAEQPKWREIIQIAHNSSTSSPLLHDLSPINQIAGFRELPLYILHGDADPTVPVEQSRAFVHALHTIDAPVIYREVPAACHDDDIATSFQDEIVEFLLRDYNS